MSGFQTQFRASAGLILQVPVLRPSRTASNPAQRLSLGRQRGTGPETLSTFLMLHPLAPASSEFSCFLETCSETPWILARAILLLRLWRSARMELFISHLTLEPSARFPALPLHRVPWRKLPARWKAQAFTVWLLPETICTWQSRPWWPSWFALLQASSGELRCRLVLHRTVLRLHS